MITPTRRQYAQARGIAAAHLGTDSALVDDAAQIGIINWSRTWDARRCVSQRWLYRCVRAAVVEVTRGEMRHKRELPAGMWSWSPPSPERVLLVDEQVVTLTRKVPRDHLALALLPFGEQTAVARERGVRVENINRYARGAVRRMQRNQQRADAIGAREAA